MKVVEVILGNQPGGGGGGGGGCRDTADCNRIP